MASTGLSPKAPARQFFPAALAGLRRVRSDALGEERQGGMGDALEAAE